MSREIELLRQASIEIKSLRRQNEIMTTRLTMFDQVMSLFNADSPNRNGMSMMPDVTWEIDKVVETFNTGEKKSDTAELKQKDRI